MQLDDLNSNNYGKKVSEILLIMKLESASILQQCQNIKNYFALTGFMDPITSMITRQVKLFFNVLTLLENRSGLQFYD